MEDFFKGGSGFVAGGDQIATGDERLGAEGFFGHCGKMLTDELPRIEMTGAGERIHAMESQMLGEAIKAKEALERGGLHARGVGKAHMVFDERENLRCLVVGEAEAAADFGGDGDADFDVAV